MLRSDLDAHTGVGRHEVLYLVEALAGEIGDGLFALAAVIIAIVESDHIQGAHRAEGARMADRLEGLRLRLCHRRILAARSCP